MKHKSTLMIADDQPLYRRALRDLIEKKNCGFVVGEFNDLASSAVAIRVKCPTALILDLDVSDCEGPDSIRKLTDRWPQLNILVLTARQERAFAARCLRARAKGYVMKQEPTEMVLKALLAVLAGNAWVSESVKSEIVDGMAAGRSANSNPIEALTDREIVVFQLLGQGLSSHIISDKLDISVKTVEAHLANMKKKLNQSTTRQVLRLAAIWTETDARRSTAQS